MSKKTSQEKVYAELLETTKQMLAAIPIRNGNDVPDLPSVSEERKPNATEEPCEKLACLMTLSPMHFELTSQYALFAFAEDPQGLVFTVRNSTTGGLEEYCACAIVHIVENLKVPRIQSSVVHTRVVLKGDARAHFILAPNAQKFREYTKRFPHKRIITPAHLFNYQPLEVDRVDEIFSGTKVESESYFPQKMNRALEMLRSSGTLAPHECSTGGALFFISPHSSNVPGARVVADPRLLNQGGREQHGKDWKDVPTEAAVVRTRRSGRKKLPRAP